MSEMRRDCLLNRWVILAPGRLSRPDDFSPSTGTSPAALPCPFCAGNEHLSGPETFALRPANTPADNPGWQIRVVLNRFPAVQSLAYHQVPPHQVPPHQATAPFSETSQPAFGVHEVVVDSPHHSSLSETHPPETWRLLLEVYQHRLLSFREDARWRHALIFKNHGPAAGASLQHPHSQILVLPHVPTLVEEEWREAEAWFTAHGRCPRCDQLSTEIAAGTRVVELSAEVAVVCPHASRFPYETWLIPRRHASHFEHAPSAVVADLAWQLSRTLTQLHRLVPEIHYNLVLQTAPLNQQSSNAFHWRVEILPRLTGLAGFEMGSGWFINPLEPELAARELRSGL
jgi:UDPglucose--hexose-1-phosphate uridylyltransferase